MSTPEKLIYIGDPMCSWCYGFAPELDKLITKHKDNLQVELIAGGLRPYHNKPISEMKDFLAHHWEEVHNATQQPFEYEILDRKDLNYDTEPGCRAAVVVRHMNPDKAFEFFHLMQKAFYFGNKDLGDVESYTDILASLDMDIDTFKTRFVSDEYKELVKKDFEKSRIFGVNSFPSVLFQTAGKTYLVARGYTTADQIDNAMATAKTL